MSIAKSDTLRRGVMPKGPHLPAERPSFAEHLGGQLIGADCRGVAENAIPSKQPCACVFSLSVSHLIPRFSQRNW